MNKRSAMVMAAGLVVALLAGGFALTNGLVGPQPSAAVASGKAAAKKPLVRTVRRTVKVHKQSRSTGTSGTATSPVTSTGSWSGEDSYENDSYENESSGDDSGSSSSLGGGDD
ncbi:MAG: hypothetical protein HY240_00395 [Actinobacteria bacterium]|nr:hypothetical protein [Actinomycetota bacterium]